MTGYVVLYPGDKAVVTMRHAPPSLETLQESVGGYIELLFNAPSPFRQGYRIIGYCNDEGMIRNLPVTYRVAYGDDLPLDVYGRIVILALRTGKDVLLTPAEIGLIFGAIKDGVIDLRLLSSEAMNES
jgi:hypothetical protein